MARTCCSSNSPLWLLVVIGGVVAAAISGAQDADPDGAQPAINSGVGNQAAPETDSVLGFTLNRIDGEPQKLEAYKGKVVLAVNVASECGLTPQYEALEKLYRARKDKGLVILGFPANNFGAQEPGSNEQILEFCTGRFEVSFPMFEKISVKGADAHPFYKRLAKAQLEVVGAREPATGGEPRWNFAKFLIDRSGRLDSRFFPMVAPDDDRLVDRIDELLARED